MTMFTIILFAFSVVWGKMTIDMEIKSILGNLKSVEDNPILYHKLATLMQLSRS